VTVSCALFEKEFNVAVIVTATSLATGEVEMGNVALLAPAATTT
jgi:hypothetical protein